MAQAQLDVPAREADRRDAASRPRLQRSRHNRIIGGVAGGVAAHLGAPVVGRCASPSWRLVLAAGFGLVVYLLLWLLAPLEAGRRHAGPGQRRPRSRPGPGGRQLTGALLVIGGVIAMLWLLGFTFEGNLFWPIVLGAIGFAVIWARTGDERRRWDPASLGSPLASVLSGGRPLARLIGGGVPDRGRHGNRAGRDHRPGRRDERGAGGGGDGGRVWRCWRGRGSGTWARS